MSIEAPVDEEADFVPYYQFDRKPVKCFEDGSDAVVFSRPRLDPSSGVSDLSLQIVVGHMLEGRPVF